ncbi:MAG: hypothetical protein U0269_16240 [Polyangiales bacterium]
MNSPHRVVGPALFAGVFAVALQSQAIRRPTPTPTPQPQPQGAPHMVVTETEVIGVTRDRATAVVRVRNTRDRNVLPQYRRVDVRSGRVLSEWTLPARDGLEASVFFGRTQPRDVGTHASAPAHQADVARYYDAISNVATSNELRFAAGQDRAVFNIGDDLWMSERNGREARKISNTVAAYGPTISPDRQRVAFTGMVGRLDGVVGNYVLHVMDLRGRSSPIRVSSTRDVWYEDLAWSADSRFVYARMGAEHPEGGCFVRVMIQPPFAVERLACVDQSERIDFVAYSPSNTFAVVHGYRVHPSGGAQHSLQWVDMNTGRVTVTARYVGVLNTGGVNDRGQLVTQTAAQRALLWDPQARTLRESAESVPVPIVFHDAAWIDEGRYVVGSNGTVRVIELGQQRWVDRGWPGI